MPDDRNRGRTPGVPPRAVATTRRPDASMLLLNEVMHTPVDPGYQETANRRRQGLEAPRRRSTTVRIVVTAILLGFAAATATVALRAPQPDLAAARDVLEQEIRDRRDGNEAVTGSITEFNREIEQMQDTALSDQYPSLLANLGRDAAATGALAVEGPGMIVTLRDGAQPQNDSASDSSTRVKDYDIQVVVNSLWESGAEAISVNGQRLTTRSAIRSAGDAILVDLVGLIGPYEIAAIGDPATLPTYFTRSIGNQHLSILGSRYGIGTSVEQDESLRLPAGQSMRLFHASVPEDLELQKSDEPPKSNKGD